MVLYLRMGPVCIFHKALTLNELTFDRLLALESSKPVLIDDGEFDTEYPEPVDDQYITEQGLLSSGQPSTPLLATIHVVRSIQYLLKLFKSPSINKETLQSRENYLSACMALFPKQLQLNSTEYLDPKSLPPVIYFQNARLVLHRHNLSPFCTTELRLQAIDQCLAVARDTAHLLSRCMAMPPFNTALPQQQQSPLDWRVYLAASASSILCTHMWRCILLLLFRSEYPLALELIRASAAIGNARQVNVSCGRNIAFFLRCLVERLQQAKPPDLDRDEEMLVYVSADMQSSTDSSWVWQGSETGIRLSGLGKRKSPESPAQLRIIPSSSDARQDMRDRNEYSSNSPGAVLSEEEKASWGGWEAIEQSVHYLLEQQQKQHSGIGISQALHQQQLTPISPQQTPDGAFVTPPAGRPHFAAGRLAVPAPSLGVNTQTITPISAISATSPASASRMTIANII